MDVLEKANKIIKSADDFIDSAKKLPIQYQQRAKEYLYAGLVSKLKK